MRICENGVVSCKQTEWFIHKVGLKLTNQQVSERQQTHKVYGLGVHSYKV